MSALVNDIHSRLNPTAVAEVVRPRSLVELQGAVRDAAGRGRPVAVCGGRHAMGGQQFRAGGLLVDTGALAGLDSLDVERGLAEVGAGIQWPALIDALAQTPWSIRQKQTGADDLSLGGAVSGGSGDGVSAAALGDDAPPLAVDEGAQPTSPTTAMATDP